MVGRRLWGLVVIGACAALSGCGSDDDGSGTGGAAGTGGSAASAGSGGAAGSAGSAGSAGTAGSGGSGECSAPPRSIWTWDLSVMPPVDVQIPASCRAESEHAYVYVADEAFGTQMTQEQVDAIVTAFDAATPADPDRGIYAIDVETFGAPPDVDGDPHIVLFYVPMGTFQGHSFDGFFRSTDQAPGEKSNQMEMLHLNAAGTSAPDSDYMLGVVAHELVHLISSQHDQNEEGWLEESLAEVAMVRTGYLTDLPAAQNYAKQMASVPLCVASYSHYGATFSWGTYLLDRFGPQLIQDVLTDPNNGRASIQAHLPSGTTFSQLFGEFSVAVLLDQPSIDPRWGLSSVDVSGLGSEMNGLLDGASHDVQSVAFGARTLRFTPPGAGSVQIALTAAEPSELVVHSVVLDPAAPAGAKVSAHASADPITITVAAGEVVDLVVAIDPGGVLGSGQNAPQVSFSYTASHTP